MITASDGQMATKIHKSYHGERFWAKLTGTDLRSLVRPLLLYSYLIRQFSHHFLLSLAAFISIFLLVDIFEKIDRLLQADLSLGSLTAYFLLKVPLAAAQILPAAVMLAVILTFGLLARRRETIAIKCAGINMIQLMVPLVALALLFSLLLALLQLYLNPWFQQQVNILWETKVENKPARELMDLKSLWYKGDRAIFHILEFRKDTKTMINVKIYAFDQNFHLIQFLAAREAAGPANIGNSPTAWSRPFSGRGEPAPRLSGNET